MAEDNDIWLPETIVLGPGGIKGYMQLGALKYMYDNHLLDNVKAWVGCSIGSIISLLMQVGFTPNEIIFWSTDVEILNDSSSIKIAEIIKNVGVISNADIKRTLIEMIESKLGMVPSLEQLYCITGYEFTIVTVRIISPITKTVYITRKTNPYLSCVDAVLLSSNIPYVFHRMSFNGYYHIDGAFGNPYPVDIADDGETNVLGLYIMSDPGSDYDNIATYTALTVYTPINSLRNMIISNSSERCKHMRLMCGQLKVGGLIMDAEQRGALTAIGVTQCQRFFKILQTDDNNIIISEEVGFISSEEDSSSHEETELPYIMIANSKMLKQIEQAVVTTVSSSNNSETTIDENDIIEHVTEGNFDDSLQEMVTHLLSNANEEAMNLAGVEELARQLLQQIETLKERDYNK